MNKDGFIQICMHPHITFSDILYLCCSTFFPHTKLANTQCIFPPSALYFIQCHFQRLQQLSDSAFRLVVSQQGATRTAVFGLQHLGCCSSGPGYDLDKDKLNKKIRIYIQCFHGSTYIIWQGKKLNRNLGKKELEGTRQLNKSQARLKG